MNRKGDLVGVIIGTIILIIVIAFIFLGMFVWGLTAPVLTNTVDDATILLQDVGREDSDQNVSQAIDSSFVQGNEALKQLEVISYLVFFALLIGFIIIAFSVRSYPFLLGFWIIGILVIAILGIFLTVAYQDIVAGDDYLSEAYQSWGFNHFLLSHLPHFVVVFGIIGGAILFLVISKDSETEVSTI